MSTLCPAAAAAWSQAMSLGRAFRPSLVTPSAMAPLETSTTLRFGLRTAATCAASRSQASPERLFEPILMTMRRARRRRARTAASSSGSPRSSAGAAASTILDLRALGDDLVERRLEPPLHVAREGGAGQEQRVDPAGELVAEVLGAFVERG